MTIREQIVNVLQQEPFKRGATAVSIWDVLNAAVGPYEPEAVKLSSISSQLAKMVTDGTLTLHESFGPRGGNGYSLAKELS